MRNASFILAGGLSLQGLHAGDWTPVQHPLERYEHIWKSSPFIAASEATPQSESLAQRYAVTGFARIGNADVVFLFDRKSLSRFSVATGSPAENVELVEVTNAEEMSSLRARIKVEGQIAEIGYDSSLSAGDSGSRPSVAASGIPTQPVPMPASPAQVSEPVAAGSPTKVIKPTRIIRRKPVDAP